LVWRSLLRCWPSTWWATACATHSTHGSAPANCADQGSQVSRTGTPGTPSASTSEEPALRAAPFIRARSWAGVRFACDAHMLALTPAMIGVAKDVPDHSAQPLSFNAPEGGGNCSAV